LADDSVIHRVLASVVVWGCLYEMAKVSNSDGTETYTVSSWSDYDRPTDSERTPIRVYEFASEEEARADWKRLLDDVC
jgi:hypothetical protein